MALKLTLFVTTRTILPWTLLAFTALTSYKTLSYLRLQCLMNRVFRWRRLLTSLLTRVKPLWLKLTSLIKRTPARLLCRKSERKALYLRHSWFRVLPQVVAQKFVCPSMVVRPMLGQTVFQGSFRQMRLSLVTLLLTMFTVKRKFVLPLKIG